MNTFIDRIEDRIKADLDSILMGTVNGSGYVYRTTTGTVNINDQVLSQSINEDDGIEPTDPDIVNYSIFLGDDSRTPQDGITFLANTIGSNATTMQFAVLIVGKVRNVGDETNPRFEIDKRMNACVSDVLTKFNADQTLGKLATRIKPISIQRLYYAKNDVIDTGEVKMKYMVELSVAFGNPDILACEY